MRTSKYAYVALVALVLATLPLAALPGTADVNVWKLWVDGLAREGFVAGYNAGTGYIVHPPLGLLLLDVAHHLSPWLGLPDHLWPSAGLTGYKVALWVALTSGALLAWRISGSVTWAALFQMTFMLNSVVCGCFYTFGIPFWLLAMHYLAERRWGPAAFWWLMATFVKWQFLIFAPFVAIYLARGLLSAAHAQYTPKRRLWTDALPALTLLAIILLVVGRGTALALVRGLAQDTLSGYALNLGWIMTWAMHLQWPESYGPMGEGLIGVIRTRDTRVLTLVCVLFGSTYVYALWRQWRSPNIPEALLRCMLAGYLAYFLFDRGAHENHLVPAVVVGGYLAWRFPQWRTTAVLLAAAANLNMFVFYNLNGSDRGFGRVWLIDWSLPLAGVYMVVLGVLSLRLCGLWPLPHGGGRAAGTAARRRTGSTTG